MKLTWYLNRLLAMEVREILWRIGQEIKYRRERSYMGQLITEPFVGQSVKIQVRNKADGGRSVLISEVPVRHYQWPKTFSKDLNYKGEDTPDARLDWEPDRHYNLQKYGLNVSRGVTTSSEILDYVDRWSRDNRFLEGIAWTSVMEVAIRAFSWFVCLENIHGIDEITQELREKLTNGLTNMCNFVASHYSRYSSANNHLLVEIMCLGIIGAAQNSQEWVELSQQVLSMEIQRQNYSDGVNKEHSIHYHSFVLESLLLYVYYMEQYAIEYPVIIDQYCKKMARVLMDFMDEDGFVPQIGDNDEGKILDLEADGYDHYNYVLQFASLKYRVAYSDFRMLSNNVAYLYPDWKERRNNFIDQNRESVTYREGGYSILRKGKVFVLMDHADLGFGAIAAHGHADALSIVLRYGCKGFFVDPGTYIYHSEKKWRDYFRMTRNHNTIEINGMDQSEMKGPFLWGRKAKTTLMKSEFGEVERIEALHDGYESEGIIHKRCLELTDYALVILDEVKVMSGDRSHRVVLSFVLDPEVRVFDEGRAYILENDGERIRINCDVPLFLENHWVSRVYGNKEKSSVLRASLILTETLEIRTVITFI